MGLKLCFQIKIIVIELKFNKILNFKLYFYVNYLMLSQYSNPLRKDFNFNLLFVYFAE